MMENKENTIWEFRVRSLNGEEVDLASFQGQVLLVVNVASRCGFTPQYAGLQKLYERYRDRGFRILAFPCNDFMNQEPGNAQEIQSFCDRNYGIGFDLFEKVKISGVDGHPLYRMLQNAGLDFISPGGFKSMGLKLFKSLVVLVKGLGRLSPNEVQWNFHKFLVNRKGIPVAHFSCAVEPLDPQLTDRIEEELSQPH